jgi:hypothetical protein
VLTSFEVSLPNPFILFSYYIITYSYYHDQLKQHHINEIHDIHEAMKQREEHASLVQTRADSLDSLITNLNDTIAKLKLKIIQNDKKIELQNLEYEKLQISHREQLKSFTSEKDSHGQALEQRHHEELQKLTSQNDMKIQRLITAHHEELMKLNSNNELQLQSLKETYESKLRDITERSERSAKDYHDNLTKLSEKYKTGLENWKKELLEKDEYWKKQLQYAEASMSAQIDIDIQKGMMMTWINVMIVYYACSSII